MSRAPSRRRAPSLAQWGAIVIAVATGLRMSQDLSWLGEWNETGNNLMTMGILGGMLASLCAALDAHRNGRALHSLRSLHPARRHPVSVLIKESLDVLAWPLVGWFLVVVTCYAATAGANPSPSHVSLWPLAAGTAFLCAQVLGGHVAGLRLHLAFALPVMVLLGFVVPAALGSLDGPASRLTPSLSVWILLPSVPSTAYFGCLTLLFLSLAALLVVAMATAVTRWSRIVAAVVCIGLGATAVNGLLEVDGPTNTVAGVSRMTCHTGETSEVCVFPDHRRTLPQLVAAADQVNRSLPVDVRPARYVENGLVHTSADALLATQNVQGFPVESVVEAAASWRVCDPQTSSDRLDFLAVRAGFIPDVAGPGSEGLSLPPSEQIAWWREGMDSRC